MEHFSDPTPPLYLSFLPHFMSTPKMALSRVCGFITESVEPISTKFNTDRELPYRTCEKMESADPRRETLRILQLLPNSVVSRMLKQDPNLAQEKSEMLDPSRPNDLKEIVEFELCKVYERLGDRGLALELTDEAREFLIDKGGDLDYGARPLRRSIESCIEDPLSEEILRGAFEGHNRIAVTVKEVGDQKQLDFEGSMVEVEVDAEAEDEDEELAAVGSGEPGEPGETGEPGESTEGDGDE